MFDFQKLIVYQKSKQVVRSLSKLMDEGEFSRTVNDQLQRASICIMLNISEGTSRFSNKDRRHFFIISRGSAFECVSILDYLKEIHAISIDEFKKFYNDLEEISKMLYSLIKKLI